MNNLMRMAYGRSGNRMGRILVTGPHQESVTDPRWLKLLLLAIWIIIPILVSRYAIPTTSVQMTVIDISKLEVKPPPVIEPPVIREPPRPKPVEPPPKPVPAPAQPAQKPLMLPPKELPQPVISRPSGRRAPDVAESQPRIARERASVRMETETPAATRLRRETAASESPADRTTITRTRGAAAADAPAARVGVAPLRRAPAAEGLAQGTAVTLQSVAHNTRATAREGSADGSAEGHSPRIAVTRSGGTEATGTMGDSNGTASVGVVRGISLASLAICPTSQAEEDAIRTVLGVVGSRRSCTDEKGEFQFKGTKRISSFNLMIFPANGRRPSNRCEELENAYKCLKTH